ncbi:hypothetical protein HDV04_001977 [Boothiomyces sp. JEL0838]|nr:hypothetical protein HDV04_001977 [Boothiomyces sp. JEL0838]
MTAKLVFQSGWTTATDCSGPPSSMYIFTENNPTIEFANLQIDTPLPLCGNANLPIPVGCCISSVDLQFTNGYHSITRNYIDQITDYTAPLSANNVKYCSIEAKGNSSNYGYNKTFILGGGNCVGNIKCDLLSNTLTIYNNTNCIGFSETYSVSSLQSYNSSLLGNVSIGTSIIVGSVNFIWEATTPFAEVVPLYKMPIEIFSAFCYALAFLIPTVTAVFYFYRYRKYKTRKDLLFSIAQLTLLINIVLQFIYNITVFPNDITTFIFDVFTQLSNVSSLFTVYISLNILFTIYTQFQGTLLEKLVYISLTLLHFSTMYWYAFGDLYGLIKGEDETFYLLFSIQGKTFFIWRTVYILVEMLPSLIILHKVFSNIEQKKVYTQKRQIYLMGLLLILQICTVLVYEILNIIVNYTLLIGGDRAYSAMFGIYYCLQALNSFFVLVIYGMLINMMVNIKGKKIVTPPSGTARNTTKNVFFKVFNIN